MLSVTSTTLEEVSSKSYMTPSGETLLGARWLKPLLTIEISREEAQRSQHHLEHAQENSYK